MGSDKFQHLKCHSVAALPVNSISTLVLPTGHICNKNAGGIQCDPTENVLLNTLLTQK